MEFLVTFRGVPEKHAERLERMLADDVALYPDRLSMESARIQRVEAKKEKKDAEPRLRKPGKQAGQHAT